MKDGRTHLAHKVEHAVDFSSGALRAITVQPGDTEDTTSIFETLSAAHAMTERTGAREIEGTITDKGYDSDDVLVCLHQLGVRSYAAEPDRGRRCWDDRGEEQARVYANRRRIRGKRGKQLQRKRAELAERSNAHMYETGGMRHLYLRGRGNIEKRPLIHGAGFNSCLVLRKRLDSGSHEPSKGS